MKLWGTNILTTVQYLPMQIPIQISEPKELRLMVDSMVPKSSAKKSLNRLLPRSRWDKIRIATYFEYDETCAVCGVVPEMRQLHCHEMWAYNNRTSTQRLDGFIAVCDPCHRVKHGVWLKQLWDGERSHLPNLAKDLRRHARDRKFSAICRRRVLSSPDHFDSVFDSLDGREKQKFIARLEKQSKAVMPCEHFLKVNNCSFRTAKEHFRKAAEEWGERSRYEWRIDYGEYSPYIREPS